MDSNCIFCKIVRGDIQANIILETETIIAFTDQSPLSIGHSLFIPKEHGEKLHDLSDEAISDILLSIKTVAKSMKIENYNILQNNGKIAHQAVFHVHFHLIPKPNLDQGLGIIWNSMDVDAVREGQEDFANKVKNSLS